jgi:hypothetical protein
MIFFLAVFLSPILSLHNISSPCICWVCYNYDNNVCLSETVGLASYSCSPITPQQFNLSLYSAYCDVNLYTVEQGKQRSRCGTCGNYSRIAECVEYVTSRSSRINPFIALVLLLLLILDIKTLCWMPRF